MTFSASNALSPNASQVLRRIKLAQPQTILQELAKAEPGVLETLLAKIKRKYERSKLMPTPRASVSVEGKTIKSNFKNKNIYNYLSLSSNLQAPDQSDQW